MVNNVGGGNNCFSYVNSSNVLIISGKIIPDNYKGSSLIEKLIIEEGIESIGKKAFSVNNLKEIEIPNSVFFIDSKAFYYNALEKVVLCNGIEMIGESAFYLNKLTNLIIPGSVKIIGDNAFGSNFIKELIINYGLEKIGRSAFNDNQLTDLIIPGSVKIIGDNAFDNNILEKLVLEDGVEIIKEHAFSKNKIKELNIPSSIKKIESHVFRNNDLTTLILNDGIAYIGEYAFSYNNIKNLIIPGSIKTITKHSFANNNIENLIIEEGVLKIEEGAFISNNLKTVLIPNSVERIMEEAFDDNVVLKNDSILMEIVDIINEKKKEKIIDIEGFYQQTEKIKCLCSMLLKYKLSDKSKYDELLVKFKKIYFKTRLEYLPDVGIIDAMDMGVIEEFNLKTWQFLIPYNIFNTSFDTVNSLVEMIEIFGLFKCDKNHWNRLNVLMDILTRQDNSITKEQYDALSDGARKYFMKDKRIELRLKEGENIPEDTLFYLKEVITPARYKYIKGLNGSLGARVNKLLSELYERREMDYYRVISDDDEFLRNIFNNYDILGKINKYSLHRMFPGQVIQFNEEAYQFLIKYFDIFLEDEKLQTMLGVILRRFNDIKRIFNLSDGAMPTLRQCSDYCKINNFSYTFGNKELATMASISGVTTEEAYQFYQNLKQKLSERKRSVLVRSNDIYNYGDIVLKGELLKMDDPSSLFGGEVNYTNSCMVYKRAGEDCLIHATTSNEGGIFRVSYLKDGVWIPLCESWDWQNENVYCHDNIEGTLELKKHSELVDAIAYVYLENAKKIILKSSLEIDDYVERQLQKIDEKNISDSQKIEELNELKELQLRQKVKVVTVGENYSDIDVSKYFKEKVKQIRQPKNYNSYSDSKEVQYILAGNEEDLISDATSYHQVPIYKDERRIIKEVGKDIKTSTLKLMHDIELQTISKEMRRYSNDFGPTIESLNELSSHYMEDIENINILYGVDWYIAYSLVDERVQIYDIGVGILRLIDEEYLQTIEINTVLKELMPQGVDKSVSELCKLRRRV